MVKLTDLNMKKEIVFDNKDYVLNEKDLGKAEIELTTFQGFNQIGSQVSGRTINSRDISIIGYILADNEKEMLDKKRNLQRLVNPNEDFYIVINNYRLRVSATSTIEYAIEYVENNKFLCKFLIEGTATNPCFTELTSTHIAVAYWKPNFHFPLVIDKNKKFTMGIKQTSMIKMIENKGEIDTGMVFTLKANVDGIKNPYILNMNTQEKLQLNCTLNTGDILKINTSYGEKSVVLNDKTDYFYTVDLDSDFLQLRVGENYFKYGAEMNEDNLDVDVDYFPQYFEV